MILIAKLLFFFGFTVKTLPVTEDKGETNKKYSYHTLSQGVYFSPVPFL